MYDKVASAAILGLILGSLQVGCTSCSTWGNPGTAYPNGYGPAAGAGSAMTVAPPANYPTQPAVDGWRAAPNGALAPSGAPAATP